MDRAARHSQVVDLGSNEDADSYVEAGWEFIGTRTGLIAKDRAILTYRLGWPLGAGDPVHPPKVDHFRPSTDPGHSAN